jgi:thiol-disulfide isomerase/thioredoxin
MNSRGFDAWATRRLAAALLLGALMVGCEPSKPLGGPVRITRNMPATGEIKVTAIDRVGYDALLAAHRGDVVLVDFWATWCEPCVAQLPHTIELGQRYADRGLAVVTVSCDEPAEADRVAKFLSDQHANGATNLISQFGGSPRTMDEFEITNGAVPFYKLYDRKGELRQTFGTNPTSKKQFTPADIEAAVEQLLTERD